MWSAVVFILQFGLIQCYYKHALIVHNLNSDDASFVGAWTTITPREFNVTAPLVVAKPFDGCSRSFDNESEFNGKIVIVNGKIVLLFNYSKYLRSTLQIPHKSTKHR